MKTRNLALIGIMIALSVVLSYVKVPSPTNSVALDALPAFALAGILGPVYGGIVGVFGHFATAANSGFALGIQSHLIICVIMYFAAYGFGFFYQKGQKILAILAGVFINVVVSLAVFTLMYGTGFLAAMWLTLTFASLFNVVFGFIVIEPVKKAINLKQ
jgi:uncharacterized membrane protein